MTVEQAIGEARGRVASYWLALRHKSRGFCQELWGWPLIVLVSLILLMLILGKTRPLLSLRGVVAESLVGHKSAADIKNLIVVKISKDDYGDLFQSKSPLKPEVVLKLIESVQQSLNPSVIGVDLDTSDPEWAAKEDELRSRHLVGGDSKVIWAEVPVEGRGGEKSDVAVLGPVLGGRLHSRNEMGLVRLPQDADGYVRRFRSSYRVQGDTATTETQGNLNEASSMPAFYRMVADTFKGKPSNASDKFLYLPFSKDPDEFPTIDAKEFVRLDESKQPQTITKSVYHAQGQEKGPIVLIGGDYPEARDTYFTPVGPRSGLAIVASAVETELSNEKGISIVGESGLILFDFLGGVLIVYLYFIFADSPVAALRSSGVAILAFFFIGAIFYFWFDSFLNVVPIMLGMVLHQMYEGSKQSIELAKKKDELIAGLQAELECVSRRAISASAPAATPGSAVEISDSDARVRAPSTEAELEKPDEKESRQERPLGRGQAAGS